MKQVNTNHLSRKTGLAILFFTLSQLAVPVVSQVPFPEPGPVFRDDILPKINLYLPSDSLDKMYRNPESDLEFQALFIFESGAIRDTLQVVGLRFRGNTSRQSSKKSIKISFNTYISKQSFFGLEKMNLNGEHNDPSVIRSKLSWDLCRSFGIPAPRANHVLLYINDKFWGVYINVEQIDEEFAGLRFGNKKGNLYKCLYPADLVFRSTDPDSYKFSSDGRRVYSLETNESADNYADLANMIDVLNNTPLDKLPVELDKVLNVGTLLKIMVLDVFIGNWDGPFYNKNNFFLYKNTATGKFELMPYDLDNTFGIDWFDIYWAMRPVYEWSPRNEPRPLYTRVLSVPAYRKEYTRLFYQLLNSISDGNLVERINSLKNLFGPYIATDPFYSKDYGWSTQDFTNSFNNRLTTSHVKIGLIPYINARVTSALSQLDAASAVDPVMAEDGIRIYPNPARDYLNIEQDGQDARFTIFGVNGSVISTGNITGSPCRIDVSQLTRGVCHIRISRPASGSTVTRTIILL